MHFFLISRRRFGESRYNREDNKSRTNFGRFGDDDDDEDAGGGGRANRFRSRFLRSDEDDTDYSYSEPKPRFPEKAGLVNLQLFFFQGGGRGGGGSGGNAEDEEAKKKERTRVVETEDASRGPLSGCIRLADSSRIIQRLKVR